MAEEVTTWTSVLLALDRAREKARAAHAEQGATEQALAREYSALRDEVDRLRTAVQWGAEVCPRCGEIMDAQDAQEAP
jgi:hypothetical protein